MRKSIYKSLLVPGLVLSMFAAEAQESAGKSSRSGSAGAAELLINPWARSAGWRGANIAYVKGIEASFINVAGTAFTEKTDVAFSNSQWLVNSGLQVNSFGFNQKVGSDGVLGASIVAVDYGEWERTTEELPEGGIGMVSPTTTIMGISYAQKFTESIYGGVGIKVYNQALSNLSVNAICFDAGVQYMTDAFDGEDNLHVGITLKNVGPATSYSGDGSSVTLVSPQGGFARAFEERSASFELPTLLNMGASYDFDFASQTLTVAASFNSNSFEKDQYNLGAEYMFQKLIGIRAGYTFFDNRNDERITTVFTGFAAGLSLEVPLGDSNFVLDYSFRDTQPFNGVHSIGVGFTL